MSKAREFLGLKLRGGSFLKQKVRKNDEVFFPTFCVSEMVVKEGGF
jgi:hypothetical protein